MGLRASARTIVAGAIALAMGGVAACVLADPPAALPVPPLQPPEIDRASTVPPLADLLTTWPAAIVIPVSADTRAPSGILDWQFLVDGIVEFSPSQDIDADGGVLLQFVPTPAPDSLDLCHTLEVRVFYKDSTGGDVAAWFYSPTGNFGDCPVFDAGPQAEDAGADADASVLDAQGGAIEGG